MSSSPAPGPRAALPALLLGVPAVLFALITWQVVAEGPLLRADERVSRALLRPDGLSGFLADLGNVPVAVPVLAAALAYAAFRARAAGTGRWWLPSAAGALLMALVPAVVVPLKELTDRPGTPVTPGTGFYPSGHAATAAVAYGAAALLLLPWLRAAARRTVVLSGAALTLGTGFGLVRHGYHWLLDVVASWCLCAVLLTGLALLLGRRQDPGPHRPRGRPTTGR
ncbi:phosphatase PAP2 family protein [Streptomyces sp. NPDC085946]|uniref:phosphatase PAP2 family protein n=1 Tax=Streptomyces sp. NPDC085946 TaxID=3365744 RepID=UPI0037D91A68